jgi:hypothetical protein
MNFVYLRSSRLHVFKFKPWFMHWQQGGERKVEKSCIASLKPIPIVKGELVHFFCIFCFWSVLLKKTSWTGFGNLCDRFWLLSCTSPGECALVKGELHMCRGSSFVSSALVALVVCSMLELVLDSVVSSRCPCLRGPSLSSFKWSCSLPLFGFRSLVRVSSVVSFLFPFLFDYQMCVLSIHSSRGRLRTMCGSRTGGWSLPGVMSDWQCYVD